MTTIRNFEDLLQEKHRLQELQKSQRTVIQNEALVLIQCIQPLLKIGSFIRAPAQEGSSLLKLGAQTGIDLLARKSFSRAGWLTRLVAPLLLSGVTGSLFDKLKARLSRHA